MNHIDQKIPSSTRLSLDAAGRQLITGRERSQLPVSGLSVTSDCANQWCRSVAQYLRAQHRSAVGKRDHAASRLTFLMWPYRHLAEEDDNRYPYTECLFVSVIHPGNERATHITFTSSTFFSASMLSEEESRVDVVQCMVPDMAEAFHLAGTLANELDAVVELLGQDTDANPMRIDPLLDEEGPWD